MPAGHSARRPPRPRPPDRLHVILERARGYQAGASYHIADESFRDRHAPTRSGPPAVSRPAGLPAVPVGELLDRLTVRGLEFLPERIRHCDQRSLLHLGAVDAQDRRHLILELEVDLRPG